MAKIKKLETKFASVPNAILQDGKLSFKARGLWAYMQSLPDDWNFSVERIAEGKDGKDSVRSGLAELEAAGYLTRRKYSVGAGGSETEYVLKFASAENPPMETVPSAENPPAGNPPVDIGITNTQVTKKQETHGTIVPAAQAPEIYGNREINDLITAMKDVCRSQGWAYDKTADRMFARHILTAKDFREFAESQNCTARDYALGIMKASAKLDFWNSKACGPKSVYQNHAKIYNAHRESKRAAAPSCGIDQAKERNAQIARHEQEAERARSEALAEGEKILAYLEGLPEEQKAHITGEVDAFLAQMNIGTDGLMASRAHRMARRSRLIQSVRPLWESAGRP